MKYREMTIHTTHDCAELVADILFELGGSGVVIVDRADVQDFIQHGRNWDYMDKNVLEAMSEHVLVKGYVEQDNFDSTVVELHSALELLRKNTQGNLGCGSLEVTSRALDDTDWVNEWKKYYTAKVYNKVVICPEWIEYEKKDGQVVVLMDPGMAFGTGEHETTSMCIELMQHYPLVGRDVIDVGCGSGILGIVAAKLGAKSVFMTDIDPIAVTATTYNAKLNGVLDTVSPVCQNLLDNRDVTGEVLLINIVADILIDLSQGIRAHIRPQGTVILSGILKTRRTDVEKAYTDIGLRLERVLEKGEWVALAFQLEG